MKTCILLFFSIATLWAKGQITFEKRYYFSEMFYAKSVLQENDSGFVIAGNGWSSNYTGYDGCLFRTNKFGDSIWLKQTGFVEDDHAYDLIKTNDNGYAYTGDIQVGIGYDDVLLVKADNNGNIEWSFNFGGMNCDEGHSLVQTYNNDFIIAGFSNSGPPSTGFYVIKTYNNGNFQWEKTIGGERAFSVCRANNNSTIVAGKISSPGIGSNIHLVKLDSNGNIVWTKTYENGIYAVCIQPILDGNYIVIATNQILGYPNQMITLKINEDGDTLWAKTYSSDESYYPTCCAPSNDGGFVITGYVATYTSNGNEILLIKADNDGNILWLKTYGNNANESGRSVKQTNDGGYIITGDGSYYCINPFIDLIKTDSLGCVKPIIDSIAGHLNVSIYDTIYYRSIDIRGEEYSWTTGFGEIVSGQGNDTVDISWNQLGTDTLQVYVSNGCGIDSMSLIINIDTCISPLLGPIYGNTDVYLFYIEEYYVNLLEGKNPVSYFWDVECGSILSGQNTPSIVVEWDQEGIGSISVTATNECGTDSQYIGGIFIIYPAVNDQIENHFSISPNPSQGIINIEIPLDIENYIIEVFDLNGRLFYQMKKPRNINQIDLSTLQKGIYLIKLKMKDKIKVEKIILN